MEIKVSTVRYLFFLKSESNTIAYYNNNNNNNNTCTNMLAFIFFLKYNTI